MVNLKRWNKVNKCFICSKDNCRYRYYSEVNPKNGKSYYDTFINKNTGNLNHSWPEKGQWVNICKKCAKLNKYIVKNGYIKDISKNNKNKKLKNRELKNYFWF